MNDGGKGKRWKMVTYTFSLVLVGSLEASSSCMQTEAEDKPMLKVDLDQIGQGEAKMIWR